MLLEDIVLILVLMEDGLVPGIVVGMFINLEGLNPCFNGRWSRTREKFIP